MPIYEFACPKCRVIYNFLSQRVNPGRLPACPKCGNRNGAADEQLCHAARRKEPALQATPMMVVRDQLRILMIHVSCAPCLRWKKTWGIWMRTIPGTWPT